MRLHRAGRGFVRIVEGAQILEKGAGRPSAARGGDFDAVRGVQAIRRGVDRDSHFYEDGSRRDGRRLVLRYEGRRVQPGRQARAGGRK